MTGNNTFYFLCLFLAGLVFYNCSSVKINREAPEQTTKENRNVPGLGVPRGVVKKLPEAHPGYILINPTNSSSSYLIDRDGKAVHEWKGFFHTWLTYLKDNGHVIRHAVDPDAPVFYAGGMAGRIEELNWEGKTIWQFEYATEEFQTHHDLAILPNGNILAISWDRISYDEAIKLGRNPDFLPPDGLWSDKIIEIKPIYPKGGEIVWEWRFRDHFVQNFDPAMANYGVPSEHPELLDINASADSIPEPMHPDTLFFKQMENKIHRNATVGSEGCDIFHCNSINYNAQFDQIAISAPHINEFFIIDHSTTREETAGHSGGRYGKGGDFLYRWGNPKNYGRGDSTDQKLFGQHDVRWLEEGLPGAGHMTMFNNLNPNGPDSMVYSTVLEIEVPVGADGKYMMKSDGTFGPDEPFWKYVAPDTVSLFSPFTSGAQRLNNGNTFILAGAPGRSFEVTPSGETVWEYWCPHRGDVREPNGDPIYDGPFMYWQFRTTFIPSGHPALIGKDLKPLEKQPKVYVHGMGEKL